MTSQIPKGFKLNDNTNRSKPSETRETPNTLKRIVNNLTTEQIAKANDNIEQRKRQLQEINHQVKKRQKNEEYYNHTNDLNSLETSSNQSDIRKKELRVMNKYTEQDINAIRTALFSNHLKVTAACEQWIHFGKKAMTHTMRENTAN